MKLVQSEQEEQENIEQEKKERKCTSEGGETVFMCIKVTERINGGFIFTLEDLINAF